MSVVGRLIYVADVVFVAGKKRLRVLGSKTCFLCQHIFLVNFNNGFQRNIVDAGLCTEIQE